MPRIERTVEIAAPIEAVFAFYADIRNHGRIAPPKTREQLVAGGALSLGSELTLRARYGGRYWTLTNRITAFQPPESGRAYFRDEQVKGPFACFAHEHFFEAIDRRTRLTDRFDFAAPCGPLGRLVESAWLTRRLERMLADMQTAAKQLLEAPYAVVPDL